MPTNSSPKPWSSRQPQAKFFVSSPDRRLMSSQCLRRRLRVQRGCATPIELSSTGSTASYCGWPRPRLFEEVQARNTELRVALEQQTATSDILRVISQSPTDVQPVFDTIAANALRLCSATFSTVGRFDGEHIHLAAHHNFNAEALSVYDRWFPRRAVDDHLAGRALLDQRVLNLPDFTA